MEDKTENSVEEITEVKTLERQPSQRQLDHLRKARQIKKEKADKRKLDFEEFNTATEFIYGKLDQIDKKLVSIVNTGNGIKRTREDGAEELAQVDKRRRVEETTEGSLSGSNYIAGNVRSVVFTSAKQIIAILLAGGAISIYGYVRGKRSKSETELLHESYDSL